MGKRVLHPLEGRSETRQDVGIEVDINRIVAKGMNAQGQLSSGMQGNRTPSYGIMHPDDFHTMLNRVVEAQHKFRMLPARVRARFHNNPELMLRFVDDKSNFKEAVKLGLIPDDPLNPVLAKSPEQVDLERLSRTLEIATPEQLKAALDARTKTT